MIKRHTSNTAYLERDIANETKGIASSIKHLLKSSNANLSALSREAGTLFYCYAYQNDIEKAKAAFVLSYRAKAQYFWLVGHPDEKLTVELPGLELLLPPEQAAYTPVELTGVRTSYEANSLHLLVHVSEAILVRDWDSVHWAIEFQEQIIPDKQVRSPSFHVTDLNLLLAWYKKDPDLGQKFLAAYKATDPKTITAEGFDDSFIDQAIDIVAPYLDVFSALLQNKETLFNQRLEEAILLRQKYYLAKDPNHPYSFISIELAMLCSIAHDKGWTITVESDYIPKWLYEKSILG